MQQIIKDGQIQADRWTQVDPDSGADLTPDSEVYYILPIETWLQFAPEFSGFISTPGVRIDAETDLHTLEMLVQQVPLIAIEFASFTDGSGFSIASLLREDHRFTGELRAFGAILPDQVPYLLRCGFNSVKLPRREDLEPALSMISSLQHSYQGDVDTPRTPFRRRI